MGNQQRPSYSLNGVQATSTRLPISSFPVGSGRAYPSVTQHTCFSPPCGERLYFARPPSHFAAIVHPIFHLILMEEKLHTAPGYCCKTVKYTRNEQRLPWLTDVQYVTVQDQVAKVAPVSDPMVTIGRAFTRHMWDCGLLDDYFPVNFVDLPIAFNCVLNLLFESSHHYYDVCVSFKFVERYPDKKHHIGVTDR